MQKNYRVTIFDASKNKKIRKSINANNHTEAVILATEKLITNEKQIILKVVEI